MDDIIKSVLEFYSSPGVTIGLLVILFIVLALFFLKKKFPKSGFYVFFEMCFEKMYDFFEDILSKDEKKWIKIYITVMFFIILISNLLGVFLEFFLPVFGHDMEHFIKIPTADINFNLAMAIIGVLLVILEQFKFLKLSKFLYFYVPFWGNGYLTYKLGNKNPLIDYPIAFFVKVFDIVISLFLSILEIIGHFAKLISLSFRLFGNVTSGGLLLTMLVGAISGLTLTLFNVEFPVVGPLIIYAQEILVSFIQALVFPLLIAIFIKVAKMH